MDKLDDYVGQVCRSIGGPWALRQHVRQELREHLLDAVAQHRAAGMAEAEALERALAEFGKPEDVRSELEATHGHRMMAVVIDKAMHWKEMTMKAKWLWTSWATLALALVIALEVLFITFNVIFIIPKFQKLMFDGIIDPAILDDAGASWMPAYLAGMSDVGAHYTTWILLAAIVVWGLFEWRVRSENKTFMRLSALGTAAVALMVVVALMAGALVVAFCLGVPAMGRLSLPFALDRIARVDTELTALETALPKKDWEGMKQHVYRADQALSNLAIGPVIPALTSRAPGTVAELRAQVRDATQALAQVRQSIAKEDAVALDKALEQFRKAYEPLRVAAKRQDK